VPQWRTPAPTGALGASRGCLRIQRSNEHECGALTHPNTERRVGPPLDPERADSDPAKVLDPQTEPTITIRSGGLHPGERFSRSRAPSCGPPRWAEAPAYR
jgi:hypothetical protein